MKDLIMQYKESLKVTRKQKAQIEKRIKPLKEMWEDNNLPLDMLQKVTDNLKQLENEKSIINSIERDLLYAIEWMITARQPGSMRGAEKRASYEKEICVDPSIFESITAEEFEDRKLNRLEKKRLDYVLSKLSKREKEVYILLKGKGYSQYYAAEMLGIARGALQTIYKRALKKIDLQLKNMAI